MLFISPPFGNYIHLPQIKSIKGSYTLEPRDGLILQILKTLRFSFDKNGWINKIGLRNKGLQYGIDNYNHQTDILSIAVMDESEIEPILNMLPHWTNIELNVSCPNTDKHMINTGLKSFLNKKRNWCIIKLSPLEKSNNIDNFYNVGFRQFHASNTLPSEKGGISGPILKSYTIGTIKYIKSQYDDSIVIAGGGIRTLKDVKDYKEAGADHFSISTLCFNPVSFLKFYFEYTDQF